MNRLKSRYYQFKAWLSEPRLHHNLPALKALTTFDYIAGRSLVLVGANAHNFKTGFILQMLSAFIVNNRRRWWSTDRRIRHYLLFHADSQVATMEYLTRVLGTNSEWAKHLKEATPEQVGATLIRFGINVTFVNLMVNDRFDYGLLKEYVDYIKHSGDRIDGIFVDDLIPLSDNITHRKSINLIRRIRSEILPFTNAVMVMTSNLSSHTRQTSWIDDPLFCTATQEVDIAFQVSIRREVPQPGEIFRVAPELQLDLVKYRGLVHNSPRLRVLFGDHLRALKQRPSAV